MNPDWLPVLKRRHLDAGDQRLSIGLIAYGSLLDPAELDVVFDRSSISVRPVRVDGYVRLFNKPLASHLRDPEKTEGRGVLNLRKREEGWFNGLLVYPVGETALDRYAFREREYDLARVSRSALTPYGDEWASSGTLESIYTCHLGEDPRLDDGLTPVEDYLKLCREGARCWGEKFHEDFLRTTLVDGEPLSRDEDPRP